MGVSEIVTIKEALEKLKGFELVKNVKCNDDYFVIKNDRFLIVKNNVNMRESSRGFEVSSKFNGARVTVSFSNIEDTMSYCDKSYNIYEVMK